MAEEKSSDSSFGNGQESQSGVVLNVYDLTPINNYTFWIGLGIFHSGIEVYGKEYGFGAHEFPLSGVFEVDPRSCPGFTFRCSISLGHTKMSPLEFREFIEMTASEYHGDTYQLITKNCNHFTDDIAWRLTGKHTPGWVNRLARLGALCSCLLPESLQVTTVKQLPEYHEVAEDGHESPSTATPQEFQEVYDVDQEKQLLTPVDLAGELSFINKTQK